MKKNILAAALVLTGTMIFGTTAFAEEAGTDAQAVAEELIGRYVTEDDVVTEEVIEDAIALLKEKYEFEELDDLKIQSTNWAYVAQGTGWFEDLKGKTIGSWNAGCQYVALVELTQDLGWVEGEDWNYENISNDSLKAALQSGEIDAISVHALTNFNNSIIDGTFREIGNAKEDGTYVNYGGASVSFTSTEFAAEHENILKAVMKLRELVNAYIILNPDETGATVEEITRIPAENTNFWNDRSKETFYASQQSLEELISDTDAYQDWLIENTEEFSEENRVDSSSYFNEVFFTE